MTQAFAGGADFNPFSGVGAAEVFGEGVKLHDGFEGEVIVTKCIYKMSPKQGWTYICEMQVLTTNDETKTPVGSKRGWTQSMAKPTAAFPSLKSYFYALFGKDPVKKEIPNEVVEKGLQASVSAAQILRGRCALVNVKKTVTEAKFDFLKHMWSASRLTQAQQEAAKAALPAAA